MSFLNLENISTKIFIIIGYLLHPMEKFHYVTAMFSNFQKNTIYLAIN